jgi:hypothetical protein
MYILFILISIQYYIIIVLIHISLISYPKIYLEK